MILLSVKSLIDRQEESQLGAGLLEILRWCSGSSGADEKHLVVVIGASLENCQNSTVKSLIDRQEESQLGAGLLEILRYLQSSDRYLQSLCNFFQAKSLGQFFGYLSDTNQRIKVPFQIKVLVTSAHTPAEAQLNPSNYRCTRPK